MRSLPGTAVLRQLEPHAEARSRTFTVVGLRPGEVLEGRSELLGGNHPRSTCRPLRVSTCTLSAPPRAPAHVGSPRTPRRPRGFDAAARSRVPMVSRIRRRLLRRTPARRGDRPELPASLRYHQGIPSRMRRSSREWLASARRRFSSLLTPNPFRSRSRPAQRHLELLQGATPGRRAGRAPSSVPAESRVISRTPDGYLARRLLQQRDGPFWSSLHHLARRRLPMRAPLELGPRHRRDVGPRRARVAARR